MNRKTQQGAVTFKNPNVSVSAEKPEEADYVNAAVCTVDKMPAITDKKSSSFTRSVPTIAVSWVILFVIMALRIYFTSVISENNNKLTAENQILKTQTTQLETRIQELETQRNNLTEQIKNMETNSIERNVSRAQWSINAYCFKIKNNARVCNACQDGWLPFQSSCYAIANPDPPGQKTWEEAQEECRRLISDLVVIVNDAEKTYVNDHSWGSFGNKGYWIGLRVVDGKWKWINGSELSKNSWIQTPTNGQCAISVTNEGWKSVSCGERNRWFCKKAALE